MLAQWLALQSGVALVTVKLWLHGCFVYTFCKSVWINFYWMCKQRGAL